MANTGKKKKIPWYSRLNSWLHLWLGIGSGIIVIIVAITGVMFVFCDDIIDALGGGSRYTVVTNERRLTPEELLAVFKKDNPGRTPFNIQLYKHPERSPRIASADENDHFGFSWVDPYTGRTLTTSNAYYFFYVVAHVHSGEMPFGHAGNLIVQIATWIFLIELVTGLVLWWPVKWTKATKEQAFTIKWKASFKRVNYDLHNVPGFYSLLPALLLTVTGLIIVNDTLSKTTHRLAGSEKNAYLQMRKLTPPFDSTRQFVTLSAAISNLFTENPGARQVRVSVPKDSATAFMAMVGKEIGLKAMDGKTTMINRYTGHELELPPKILKGIAVDGMIMNLHIGFWGGWFGKILTAVTGLICAALPVTGFLIWWGRRNKKKKNKRVL